MTDRLILEIISPERSLVREEADMVTAPGSLGEFGVLPGHAPFMTTLGIGEVSYVKGGETAGYLAVAGGYAEVLNDRMIILAETAEMAEEIDVARAKAALERAEKRLFSGSPDIDVDRARLAMMRALTRLKVAEKVKRKEGAG